MSSNSSVVHVSPPGGDSAALARTASLFQCIVAMRDAGVLTARAARVCVCLMALALALDRQHVGLGLLAVTGLAGA